MSIMKLNENIMASIFLDEKGRIKEMESSDNSVFGNLDASQRTALFDDLVLRQMTRREFDGKYGLEEYTITKRSKMNIMSFPVNGDLLIVIAQPFIDTYHICKKILKIIQQ